MVFYELLDDIAGTIEFVQQEPSSYELSQAIIKLYEAEMWLRKEQERREQECES